MSQATEDQKRTKNRRIGKIVAVLIRVVSWTLRVKLHDHCGFLENRPDHSLIHATWHNTIFALMPIYSRHWPDRKGAALTSASKDGEIVAAALESFGVPAVRGSNNRRGAAALIELKKWLDTGHDIMITPDGPQGPRHELNPGVIILAQKGKAPIFPVCVRYRSAWKLKTWDRFEIPYPFSALDVHLGPYLEIPPTETPEEFEAERLRVQAALCGAARN